MAPTAPPNLHKTDEAERSDRTSQMVPLMRENTLKSKVTAVRADLPAHNSAVATQHHGSRAYGAKINKWKITKLKPLLILLYSLTFPFSVLFFFSPTAGKVRIRVQTHERVAVLQHSSTTTVLCNSFPPQRSGETQLFNVLQEVLVVPAEHGHHVANPWKVSWVPAPLPWTHSQTVELPLTQEKLLKSLRDLQNNPRL